MKKNIKKILAVGGCIAFLGATLTGCADVRMTQDDYDLAIEDAKASVDITTDNAGLIAKAVAGVDITSDNDGVIATAVAGKDTEITRLNKVIDDAKQVEAEVEAETEAKGYTLDELNIGVEFSKTLSDRELNLFDGEIDFDRDDYDAEELFYLINLKVAANQEDDWNTNTFLQIPEGGIRYTLELASDLNLNDIEEDETLKFDFLGEEVEISEWNDNEITFTRGTDLMFEEDIAQTVEGKNIVVDVINDDYIHIVVDGTGKKIYEGQTKTVNGMEIKVVAVMVNDEDDKTDKVDVEIGEEVEFTIKDGEEYVDDSIWDYIVDKDTRTLGLTLNEEFMSIDEDEDFKALAAGEKLCLPNEYVCVAHNGLTVEDTEDYDFELRTRKEVDYLMVKGEFIDGIEDYSKIYINESGSIFDDDYELINSGSIELADTDLTLETDGTNITIESDIDVLVRTNFALDMLEVDNEISIATEDEDYITDYGIIIKNPEDNMEDNELELIIPEEELEANIVITSK